MLDGIVRKFMPACLSLISAALMPGESFAETLTMTTWYPAPVGVYRSLITTGGSPSNTVNTILSRDAGNVGIGTASPNAPLSIQADPGGLAVGLSFFGRPTADDSQIYFFKHDQSTLNGFIYSNPSQMQLGTSYAAPLRFTTESSEKMRIDASGNVGIGTTSPQYALDVSGSGGGPGALRIAATNAYASGAGNFDLIIGHETTVGNTELRVWRTAEVNGNMVIESNRYAEGGGSILLQPGSGNVGIGTNSPGYKLDVNGSIRGYGITDASDLRLKKDVEPLSNSLDKILALRGVRYQWKDAAVDPSPQIGLIGQEVEKVYPELVKTDDQGRKSLNYSHLVAPLIEAIKQQQAAIKQLESDNGLLREKVESLERRQASQNGK